jgi:hypothetical protein
MHSMNPITNRLNLVAGRLSHGNWFAQANEIGIAIQEIEALVEQRNALLAACKTALRQINDLDETLNQPNHQVYGWHYNGESEPATSFFESNDYGAVGELEDAIDLYPPSPETPKGTP